MKTLFNLFTILVTWLCIDGLNGDILCEVCSDSNDPNCRKVELKRCEEPYCSDSYFQPSSDIKSPKGRLIKQCGLVCQKIGRIEADLCKICTDNKCNQQKTIEYYANVFDHEIKPLYQNPGPVVLDGGF